MKLIWQSIRLTIVFTVMTGVIYPLVITASRRLLFMTRPTAAWSYAMARWSPNCSRSSSTGGKILLAATFCGELCHRVASVLQQSRPDEPGAAVQRHRQCCGVPHRQQVGSGRPVPADMVFTSASGLDPHISPEAARLQVARVAAARGMGADQVKELVERFVESPQWGIFGEARVNVLRLNLALDEMDTKKVEGNEAIKG